MSIQVFEYLQTVIGYNLWFIGLFLGTAGLFVLGFKLAQPKEDWEQYTDIDERTGQVK